MPFRIFAVLLLPAFAMACAAVFYLTGHPLRAGLLDADALYLPTLFDDLLRHGGHLSDWFLTPAPYLFPDTPIYALAWLLAPDSYHQIIVFACLQCALLLAALVVLAREVGIGDVLPCAALSVTALLGLALTGQVPFVLTLSNAFHFGGFVTTVFILAAWLRVERTGSYPALWTVCVLAFVSALSDSLFMVHAALPLSCTAFLRILVDRDYLAGRRGRYALPWLPLGAALLGNASYRFVVTHATRYPAQLDLQNVAVNLHDLAIIALRLWHAMPFVVVGWSAFAAFAVACTVGLVRGRPLPLDIPRRLAWLLPFWLISTAGMVAVSLLVSNLPVADRYFIPAACWPVLLAPLLAARVLRARASPAILACSLACCAAMGAATFAQWRAHPLQAAYYPAEVACMDRALARFDLHHGIAQYWNAKPFQRFSHGGITLAPHTDLLQEVRWIGSTLTFRPAYDFALVGPPAPVPHNIVPARAEAINGQPAERVRCGAYTLMVYGRDKMKVR